MFYYSFAQALSGRCSIGKHTTGSHKCVWFKNFDNIQQAKDFVQQNKIRITYGNHLVKESA